MAIKCSCYTKLFKLNSEGSQPMRSLKQRKRILQCWNAAMPRRVAESIRPLSASGMETLRMTYAFAFELTQFKRLNQRVQYRSHHSTAPRLSQSLEGSKKSSGVSV